MVWSQICVNMLQDDKDRMKDTIIEMARKMIKSAHERLDEHQVHRLSQVKSGKPGKTRCPVVLSVERVPGCQYLVIFTICLKKRFTLNEEKT